MEQVIRSDNNLEKETMMRKLMRTLRGEECHDCDVVQEKGR